MSAPETMITWSGTRHNLSNIGTGVRRRRAACSTSIWMYEHDQTRTHRRDCKRCFPPSPDFSSSTLTDLQKAHRQIAELRQRIEHAYETSDIGQGCRDYLLQQGDFAAPVDGAE